MSKMQSLRHPEIPPPVRMGNRVVLSLAVSATICAACAATLSGSMELSDIPHAVRLPASIAFWFIAGTDLLLIRSLSTSRSHAR